MSVPASRRQDEGVVHLHVVLLCTEIGSLHGECNINTSKNEYVALCNSPVDLIWI